MSNGYPKTLIHQHWRPPPTLTPPPSPDMPKATITLLYVRHLAESICRTLVPLNVRVCFRPHRTLKQSLVRLKDCTPPEKKAGVVYRIPCGTCGQTGRTLDQRLKEHKRALTSGNPAHSACSRACNGGDARDKLEEAQVVDSHPHYTQRCTLEACHIRSKRNNLNRDVDPLPSTYNPLIYSST